MDTATLIITAILALISITIYLANKLHDRRAEKTAQQEAIEAAKKHLFFTQEVLGQIITIDVDSVKQGRRVVIKYNYGYCRKDFCVLVSATETKTVYTVTHRE